MSSVQSKWFCCVSKHYLLTVGNWFIAAVVIPELCPAVLEDGWARPHRIKDPAANVGFTVAIVTDSPQLPQLGLHQRLVFAHSRLPLPIGARWGRSLGGGPINAQTRSAILESSFSR